ncbi:MAG: polysaccharide deacetylase family protein [Acidimicrobiia bacterium]|nr:polysaccharide deacetylase family protein [Acidimicrobiia bacterium]
MRRLVYAGAGPAGVNRLARRAFRSRLLVLCFHGVCAEGADVPDSDGMHVPAARFEEQVRFLVRGYRPVSLAQVRRSLLEGAALPRCPVLITFDDGYRNVARNALPVLRRQGVPCVLFVVTGAVDQSRWLWPAELEWRRSADPDVATMKRTLKRAPAAERRRALAEEFAAHATYPECDSSLLDWSELRDLAGDDLVAVGSHAVHHEALTTCDPDDVRGQLADSRRRLADELGIEVDAVAYPDGEASAAVADAARASGYHLGFTTEARHVGSGDDPLLLPRLLVGAADEETVLAARLAGWQEWIRRL